MFILCCLHYRNISGASLWQRAIGVFFICVAIFIFSIKTAQAEPLNGDGLMQICRPDPSTAAKTKDDGRIDRCRHYISGVMDYHSLLNSLGTIPVGANFCVPFNTSELDIQKAVYAFLKEHPRYADRPAVPAVAVALSRAFPCKGNEIAMISNAMLDD